MYKKLFLIGGLLALIILVTGCGISQVDYDKALSTIASQNLTIFMQQNEMYEMHHILSSMVQPPRYFENRTAIETWLNITPKLGVSKDVKEWYQFALYYQQKALQSGYIVSVAYWKTSDGMTVWCEIVAQDGWVYYFNPDDCRLVDSNFRIDMVDNKTLENTRLGSLQ
jgi:hypothetical protein